MGSFYCRPEGLVWEIQVQSLDHKTFLPAVPSKTAPVALVEKLKPGKSVNVQSPESFL